MDRRKFLQLAALGSAGVLPLLTAREADAAMSDLKITRVRIFNPTDKSDLSGWLNLGEIIVAVDTDAGLTGWGQGGSPDLIRYPAGRLIGEDPFRIEYHWQRMYRGSIYPAGSERLLAVGALDCALWDIKGKALEQPVYQLLGGKARDHVECYHSFGALAKDKAKQEARKAMADGFRAIRFHTVPPASTEFDVRKMIDAFVAICAELREGVGPNGDFILDAHTRFDFADIARLCDLVAPYAPLFVEDPLRSIEDITAYTNLRRRVTVPLAAGEQFGDLRNGNLPLVENGLIDYLRTSIPNCGGITSYRVLAALCDAHSVGARAALHRADRDLGRDSLGAAVPGRRRERGVPAGVPGVLARGLHLPRRQDASERSAGLGRRSGREPPQSRRGDHRAHAELAVSGREPASAGRVVSLPLSQTHARRTRDTARSPSG